VKLLVLGGSGNLGATLCVLARESGHEVMGTFSRRAPSVSGVHFVQWDARVGKPPNELSAWRPRAADNQGDNLFG
jgi:predicted dinucleotide-binding enzyme